MLAIPNIFFILLLAINTAFLTFLTTKGGLTDNRYSNPWKRLTKRGKQVLLILILMGLLLIAQEWNTNTTNDKKEFTLKTEREQKDSIITNGIKKGVDSASRRLFDDISKAFAKQEFRLDTVKKDVERIRDSARGITNNFSQPDPVLSIAGSGVLLTDTVNKHYSIEFISVDAGSTNFDIKCYLLTEFTDGSYDVSRAIFFPKKMSLPKNGKWTSGFSTNISKKAANIYFYVIGKFTTLDGTKSYDVDDVYDFEVKAKHTSILVGKAREEQIKIIRSVPEKEFK